jgi:hypothetical protein
MLQPKKRQARLYVRLAAEEKEQLQLLANTHQSTLSEAARTAIRKYLRKYAETAAEGPGVLPLP